MKISALSQFRLDCDGAAMSLDDFLANGQPDAGAGEFFAFVQSLKDAKDPSEVLTINSQP